MQNRKLIPGFILLLLSFTASSCDNSGASIAGLALGTFIIAIVIIIIIIIILRLGKRRN